MKKKIIEKFVTNHLLPSLKGFHAQGNLFYELPVGNVLRAFLFDSSAFSASTFHPQVFVQLLYVPSNHLTLTPGKRFLGAWEFKSVNEVQLAQKLLHQIYEVGIPFLRAHGTPEDMIRETRANPARSVNPHVQRQLVYSLFVLGRNEEGLDELDRLLGMLGRIIDPQPWEREIHAEVGALREKLMRNPREVIETLQAWTEQTRTNLGLQQ